MLVKKFFWSKWDLVKIILSPNFFGQNMLANVIFTMIILPQKNFGQIHFWLKNHLLSKMIIGQKIILFKKDFGSKNFSIFFLIKQNFLLISKKKTFFEIKLWAKNILVQKLCWVVVREGVKNIRGGGTFLIFSRGEQTRSNIFRRGTDGFMII